MTHSTLNLFSWNLVPWSWFECHFYFKTLRSYFIGITPFFRRWVTLLYSRRWIDVRNPSDGEYCVRNREQCDLPEVGSSALCRGANRLKTATLAALLDYPAECWRLFVMFAPKKSFVSWVKIARILQSGYYFDRLLSMTAGHALCSQLR